jgi:outer membrane biosynthesis protein TonB
MQMKKAAAISTGLHAAVLLWATLSFSGKTFEVTPAESLPVDFISEKDFSEMTKGVKDAPKPDKPKPLVEKKADQPKPVEEHKIKVTEKPEIKPTAEKVAQPPPEPKPEKQHEKAAKAAPQEPPQPAAQAKADPIADKLEKQDDQKLAKIAPRLPPRRPPQPHKEQPKFDANQIAALLDKRAPQRMAAAGAELNSAPSLGTAAGSAAKLSQSEIDALRARLMALWNPPVGMQDADQSQVTIRIRFKRDGTLAAGPQVLTSGSGVRFNAMRDSAVRAVFVGQPYTMLRPEHYDTWKEIDFTFDAKEMFHDIPVR